MQDLPAIDVPAEDGVVPKLAGPQGDNGEFDTPIDPRFPTYLATERHMQWIQAGFFAVLPFIAATVGVVSGGAASDWLLRRTGSANLARKTPVVCGLVLATSIFAANYLGAIAMPINWRLAAPEVRFILEHSAASALVCDESLVELADEATKGMEAKILRSTSAP